MKRRSLLALLPSLVLFKKLPAQDINPYERKVLQAKELQKLSVETGETIPIKQGTTPKYVYAFGDVGMEPGNKRRITFGMDTSDIHPAEQHPPVNYTRLMVWNGEGYVKDPSYDTKRLDPINNTEPQNVRYCR